MYQTAIVILLGNKRPPRSAAFRLDADLRGVSLSLIGPLGYPEHLFPMVMAEA